MSHNVPVVTEGFLCPTRKMRKHFTGTKNFGGEKNPQRAKPDWVFSQPEPPPGGEAVTILLYDVVPYLLILRYHFF